MAFQIWLAFLAGLWAPLGALCVLPLYPAFLAYLSSKFSGKEEKKTILFFGLLVVLGVIVSMFIVGLIFVFFLQQSLTQVIGIVSPIAFIILAIISILLIFNFNFTRYLPKFKSPAAKNPLMNAFLFGLFFGVVVLPCNPASLAVLFAVSATTMAFITNLLNFIFFGVGMALPLLILAIVSAQWSQQVIGWLSNYQRAINIIAGIIMLAVSIYYLFFVFF